MLLPMRFTRITATPVVVPNNPDSIFSPGIVDDWSKSPGIGKTSGGGTDKFPTLAKYILKGATDNGITAVGETYRAIEVDNLHRNARILLDADLMSMPWAHLPIPMDREYDGFEVMVYDAVGQHLGLPIYQLLGGKCRDQVYVSTWTGRRTPEDAGRKAAEGWANGFDVIKYKCNDQDDVAAWAAEVAKQASPDMKIIFDPNQRWGDFETAKRYMEQLGEFNVLGIEDPITRDQFQGFRDLRGVGGLKVVIHISLPYCVHGQAIDDVIPSIQHDCCDAFNFNGPMAAFVQLCELATLAGKPVWHGSEVDLGILEASYVHAAAAAPACTWPSDILGRLVREHDLLTEPLDFDGCHINVPTGPGIGVELDDDAVEKYRNGEDIVLG